jgi:hypothetical protein
MEVGGDWIHVRYSQVVGFTPLACCLPAKEPHYPLYKVLGGSHRRSAYSGEEKFLPLSETVGPYLVILVTDLQDLPELWI